MELFALAADEPGEMGRDRGLSPYSPYLLDGSLLIGGSEYALFAEFGNDNDLSWFGWLRKDKLELGELSTLPRVEVRGGVLGFPILESNLLSYA